MYCNDSTTNTYYIRDAQGNTLAIYTYSSVSDSLKWAEQQLYGSSRLGILKWADVVTEFPPVVVEYEPIYDSLLFGSREYELTNHLGNVLTTVSDKKIGNDSSGLINYYIAEVLSQNDYYPFGMLMPGRSYNVSTYRFGFNGKENDSEVKGLGNQQDYGMRIYDPRMGRFLGVDPLTKYYASWSPYPGNNNQVTKTLYDEPVNPGLQSSSTSRKRVVASVYLENKNDVEGDSTIYSYDILGNVKTLVQHVQAIVYMDAYDK